MKIENVYQKYINEVAQELIVLSQFDKESFEYTYVYGSYNISPAKQDNFLRVLSENKVIEEQGCDTATHGSFQESMNRARGVKPTVISRKYTVNIKALNDFIEEYDIQKKPTGRVIYERPSVSKDGEKLTIDGVSIILKPKKKYNDYSILAEVLFSSEELSINVKEIQNQGHWEDRDDDALWTKASKAKEQLNTKIYTETKKENYVRSEKPLILVNLDYLKGSN